MKRALAPCEVEFAIFKSTDSHYKDLICTLNSALKELAAKITPKIYEYGFLRE